MPLRQSRPKRQSGSQWISAAPPSQVDKSEKILSGNTYLSCVLRRPQLRNIYLMLPQHKLKPGLGLSLLVFVF